MIPATGTFLLLLLLLASVTEEISVDQFNSFYC